MLVEMNAPLAINDEVAQRKRAGIVASNSRSSALIITLLSAITAAGAVLRFHILTAKSFWFDEGASVGIARLDWYNFVRILWRREANMTLYYLVLRGWLHFGSSEWFIRSLSALQLFAHRAALRSLQPVFSEIRRDAFPSESHRLHCSGQHGCVRSLFFWSGVAGPLDFPSLPRSATGPKRDEEDVVADGHCHVSDFCFRRDYRRGAPQLGAAPGHS